MGNNVILTRNSTSCTTHHIWLACSTYYTAHGMSFTLCTHTAPYYHTDTHIIQNLPGESKEQDGTAEREHRSDAVAPAHSHTHPSSRMPTPATRTQHSNTSSTTTSSQTPQLNAPAETQKETIERLHTQNKNLLALAAEQQEIIQQLIAWVKVPHTCALPSYFSFLSLIDRIDSPSASHPSVITLSQLHTATHITVHQRAMKYFICSEFFFLFVQQTSTRQSKQAKNSSRTTTKANNSAEHDNLFIQDLMKQIEKLKNTVRAKDETIQQLHAINIWNNEQ